MNTQEQQMLIIPSETALLVDQSDSDWCLAAIAWASCCLFSVEQCMGGRTVFALWCLKG